MASEPTSKHIIIIGGGIIGSTTAYYLTRHPSYSASHHKVTLLEATTIASGASGKAGGLLALWAYPKCLVPLSFRLHRELAEEHGGKEKWGYRGVGVGNIELVGRKVPKDSIRAANKEGRREPITTTHKHDVAPVGDGNHNPDADVSLGKELGRSNDTSNRGHTDTGLPDDLDWVASECVRGWTSMGSSRDTAQVHPYQFTTSIAQLAEERGVQIVQGAKVDEVLLDGRGSATGVRYTDVTSKTSHTLSATDIIITAGPWTQRIWPAAPIGHLRAHSVCIRPSRPVSAHALFTDLQLPKNFKEGGARNRANLAVSPEIYARPNNELYACGEGDHLVDLPETSADVVVDDARCQDIVDYCASFSDEMRDGEVLVRQACYLPMLEYGSGPLVGPSRTKGVWIAAGHTCWGIQNGPATGKVMSELVFDGVATSAKIASLDPREIMRR